MDQTGTFALTRWSAVLACGSSDPQSASKALTWLCEAYWQPLVEHARRRGCTADAAQDVVQDFFARLLEKRDLAADPARGRFRSYLIGALDHFLANQRERGRALKRGGGVIIHPLPTAASEPMATAAPEQAFTRTWAITMLDRVLERLTREYQAPERARIFGVLKPLLTGDVSAESYGDIGKRLGMSPGAVKVAVHRLRSRYRDLLRQEVAQTVEDPSTIDDELRDLMAALRG